MDWQLNKFLLHLCGYSVCVRACACHDVEARGWLAGASSLFHLCTACPGYSRLLKQPFTHKVSHLASPVFLSGLPSSALGSVVSAESPCRLRPPSCFLWNSHLLTFELETCITWSSRRWNSSLSLLRTEINWSTLPGHFKVFLICRLLAFPLCRLDTSIKMSFKSLSLPGW